MRTASQTAPSCPRMALLVDRYIENDRVEYVFGISRKESAYLLVEATYDCRIRSILVRAIADAASLAADGQPPRCATWLARPR